MKFKFEKFFLSFTVFMLFSSCSGQTKKTTEQDKSNNLKIGQIVKKIDENIWNIFQDRNNNYWFGSNENGVYRYDGKVITQFTTKDGLINNSIRGVQEDNEGILYFETPQGISKFDGIKFQTLKPVFSSMNEWRLDPNDLWFNCIGKTLCRYDGEHLYELLLPEQDLKKAFGVEVTGVSFENMNNSPYAVYGIDKDKAGNLWFGTVSAGAFRYDGNSFLWIAEKELSTLPDGRVPGVRSMLEDKNGHFWLSNFISKYNINDSEEKVTYEKQSSFDESDNLFKGRLPYFNAGLVAKDGNLWMTTYGGGVWVYDGETLQNYPVKEGKTDVLLVSVYEDNDGVLWLGTHNGGIYNFNGKEFLKFEI